MSKNLTYGIVFFMLSTLVGVFFYYLNNKTELNVEREYPVNILSKSVQTKDLNITYKQDTIESLSMVLLKISNNSSKDIIDSDFITPLQIEFNKEINIISFNKERSVPKEILTNIKKNSFKNSLNVRFDLLNRGDEVYIWVLYEGELTDIKAIGRIKGIKNVSFTVRDKPKDGYRVLLGFFLVVVSSLLLILLMKRMSDLRKTFLWLETYQKTSFESYKILFNDVNSLCPSYYKDGLKMNLNEFNLIIEDPSLNKKDIQKSITAILHKSLLKRKHILLLEFIFTIVVYLLALVFYFLYYVS